MAADIETFCASCEKCQMNKSSTMQPQGILHGLPILERPCKYIGIDSLPQFYDYDYLMVIIDHLSSEVHLAPTTMQVTAQEIAWLFLKEVVQFHGVPDSIVLDHDLKFTSIFWYELQHLMRVKLLMSTAFHPQNKKGPKVTGEVIYQYAVIVTSLYGLCSHRSWEIYAYNIKGISGSMGSFE